LEGDLTPNDNTISQDTIVQPIGIITGQKFLDLNGNGQHDTGEPGLNGVTIQLLDASGKVVMSTPTHSIDLNGDGIIDPQTEMGRYSLQASVAGTYQVREQSTSSYVQTMPTGMRTDRVSVNNSGVQANRSSARASISADGRLVAFDSSATNLVPGDTNGASDI